MKVSIFSIICLINSGYALVNQTVNEKMKKKMTFITSCTIVVYLTSSCVHWAFFGMSGPRVPKKPNLHTKELNTTFFFRRAP
jgi:hypothetical protein